MDNKSIAKMLDDPREIDSLVFEDNTSIKVGNDNVEKIEAYGEASHFGDIPWLAIIRGGKIAMRIPAVHVSVLYGAATDE